MNIEAVIFVLLSLGGQSVLPDSKTTIISVLAGIFSIYVILIQYYINELNYNERVLRSHYHQLEIEDLILRLKKLIIKTKCKDEPLTGSDCIKRFYAILFEYQTILKNNENHDPVDYKKYLIDKSKNKEYSKKIFDFTIDNIVLHINFILVIILPWLTIGIVFL